MEKVIELVKIGLKKTISGFMLGIGFGISFFVIATITANYIGEKFEEDPPYPFNEGAKTSGIKILEHKDQRNTEKLIVIGSLINSNESRVKSIMLEAEFFKKGVFVDECTEYITTNLNPGETENFKISCGGCGDYVVPEYDDYTVAIKSTH
jgi:hypothetical protein